MSSFDLQIILAGFLVALPCALLGTFLVLRKMVMLGDAISHAVLPGIVIAFLFSGERNSGVMLVSWGFSALFLSNTYTKKEAYSPMLPLALPSRLFLLWVLF